MLRRVAARGPWRTFPSKGTSRETVSQNTSATRLISGTPSNQNKEQGYQSIGSFHNDNLAEMIAQDETSYQPPQLPFEPQTILAAQDNRCDFGLDLDTWTFLNHGAFGGALCVGTARADDWRRYAEQQPLRYHDRMLLPHLAHSARLLAQYMVGGNHNTIPQNSSYALLPNVTSGMNAVLQNYCQRFGAHGHVIFWDVTYGSVKAMARHYGRHGKVTEIPLLNQLANSKGESNQHVWSQALMEHVPPIAPSNPPPLLLMEHATSNTALTFNVKAAAAAIRTHVHPQALVVVDGAHGLWASDTASTIITDNDLESINVYVANGHKWLCAPRGVALAWARNEASSEILLRYPAVLSHGMHAADLLSRFVWDGCRDYTAALAIPAVLDYWKNTTGNAHQVKHHLWQGLVRLANQWHGMPLDEQVLRQEGHDRGVLLAPDEWLQAPMVLLRLPQHWEKAHNTSSDAKRIQDFLYSQNVEVPIKCIASRLYVRISNHVYSRPGDMDRLGRLLIT